MSIVMRTSHRGTVRSLRRVVWRPMTAVTRTGTVRDAPQYTAGLF